MQRPAVRYGFEAGLRHLFWTLLSLPVAAMAGSFPVSDTLKLNGRVIELENRSGRCFAFDRTQKQSVDMNISAPCKFLHRDKSPEIIVHRYPKIGSAVIVAGRPIAEEQVNKLRRRHPDIYAGAPCSTEWRRLVLPRRGAMYASYNCLRDDDHAVCYQMGVDEKDYYSLAHHKFSEYRCDARR